MKSLQITGVQSLDSEIRQSNIPKKLKLFEFEIEFDQAFYFDQTSFCSKSWSVLTFKEVVARK